ncbi:hypothetical protein E3N88_14052 [Mikania micrantha]|uniref:Uncharacterized protein n=1 Tax=Mikania micrantha TaxID=192012 RepID=A0A5N6P0P9_9ASTR|nr:hypothetical protein E3N88_14052 [Mikania micrantha]
MVIPPLGIASGPQPKQHQWLCHRVQQLLLTNSVFHDTEDDAGTSHQTSEPIPDHTSDPTFEPASKPIPEPTREPTPEPNRKVKAGWVRSGRSTILSCFSYFQSVHKLERSMDDVTRTSACSFTGLLKPSIGIDGLYRYKTPYLPSNKYWSYHAYPI